MRRAARQVDKDERLLRFAAPLLRLGAQEFRKAQAAQSEPADAQERTARMAVAIAFGRLVG